MPDISVCCSGKLKKSILLSYFHKEMSLWMKMPYWKCLFQASEMIYPQIKSSLGQLKVIFRSTNLYFDDEWCSGQNNREHQFKCIFHLTLNNQQFIVHAIMTLWFNSSHFDSCDIYDVLVRDMYVLKCNEIINGWTFRKHSI